MLYTIFYFKEVSTYKEINHIGKWTLNCIKLSKCISNYRRKNRINFVLGIGVLLKKFFVHLPCAAAVTRGSIGLFFMLCIFFFLKHIRLDSSLHFNSTEKVLFLTSYFQFSSIFLLVNYCSRS